MKAPTDISSAPSVHALPPLCPSRAAKALSTAPKNTRSWVRIEDVYREPFRLFFPLAILAGLIGVALWPLMMLGWLPTYPGPSHARLLVQGFFGGFIFGFLGTSVPRLVEAKPLSSKEALALLCVMVLNVAANTLGMTGAADILFVAELALWLGALKRRCKAGQDRPPPSFVLVGLAFASALAGTVLQLLGQLQVLSQHLQLLARLLSYHGFVLLCILGAGGFLLPRFLGLGLRRAFTDSRANAGAWQRSSRIASGVGVLILMTYALESLGWGRTSAVLRAGVVLAYLAYEMPLERLAWQWKGVQWQLAVGIVCIPSGILASGWKPETRMTLTHLELLGGYALLTTAVATRIVFGHSGGRERLERFHGWLTASAILMLLGLVSRLTSDFIPAIQASHYIYGAACWIAGVLVWAACVLPRVVRPDPES